MLSVLPLQTLAIAAPAAFLLYHLIWIIYTRFFHPYSSIPGPFLASITTWHRWYSLRYELNSNIQRPLHDKYGPIVRIAPDEVQISDPSAIDVISRSNFVKSEFYDNFNNTLPGRIEIFAERNEKLHTAHKKLLWPLFRPESIAKYEGYVDNIIAIFCEKLAEREGEAVDLADWVARFSWDTVGEMVYSYQGGFGMLRDDVDYMGWMNMVRLMQWQMGQLGYVPKGLQKIYMAFQLLVSRETRKGISGAMTVTEQIRGLLKKRKEKEALGEEFSKDDMLTKMLRMTEDEKINWVEDDIIVTLNAFVWAGSDTTGSVLGMVLYFILRDPRIYSKLQQEIDSSPVHNNKINYHDATALPYLTACINESLRHHGILGTGLPRVVPPGGAQICGRYFPGGYKVQMNHNVTQFDKSIFGDDADDFRPERWIDSDAETRARMHRHIHTFGFGNRVCLGKTIALNEIYKFVPPVLKKFQFEVKAEPRVSRGWFQGPSGFMVKVSKR